MPVRTNCVKPLPPSGAWHNGGSPADQELQQAQQGLSARQQAEIAQFCVTYGVRETLQQKDEPVSIREKNRRAQRRSRDKLQVQACFQSITGVRIALGSERSDPLLCLRQKGLRLKTKSSNCSSNYKNLEHRQRLQKEKVRC